MTAQSYEERQRGMSRRDQIVDDLRLFTGAPPYGDPGNWCRGDGYFLHHIERKYGARIADLKKEVGWPEGWPWTNLGSTLDPLNGQETAMPDPKDTPDPEAAPVEEADPFPEFTECYLAILAAFPQGSTHHVIPTVGGAPILTAHTILDGKEYVVALLPTDNTP